MNSQTVLILNQILKLIERINKGLKDDWPVGAEIDDIEYLVRGLLGKEQEDTEEPNEVPS